MKKIILCSDDYAQNEKISQGILQLIKNKRLSAVSCFSNSPYWPLHAKWLIPYYKQIDIGLHFNLTQAWDSNEDDFKKKSLSSLMIKALGRQINISEIRSVFTKQLNLFMDFFGRMPDFIDGHQHVHHLPIIREAILSCYREYFIKGEKPYIRIASNRAFNSLLQIKSFPKSQIISLTGALVLRKKLITENIPFNKSFSGIYNFSNSKNYANYFQYFLSHSKNNELIMCHPGLKSKESHIIDSARYDEYSYLQSEAFIEDCAKEEVYLGRFFS